MGRSKFVEAVKATGRKKLIFAALWTEVCLAFPVLEAIKAGYEVYAVDDASGGTSLTAHNAAMRRRASWCNSSYSNSSFT